MIEKELILKHIIIRRTFSMQLLTEKEFQASEPLIKACIMVVTEGLGFGRSFRNFWNWVKKRIKDMDAAGVDTAILSASLGVGAVTCRNGH